MVSEKLIKLNFLPTFENYFGRDIGTRTYRSASLSVKWTHQFDEQGRLLKSQMYELVPDRILKEFSFTYYPENTLKMNLKIDRFNYYSLRDYDPVIYELYLDKNYTIQKIVPNEDPRITHFKELDENKRITLVETTDKHSNTLYFAGYHYDEKGNIIEYMAYDSDLILKSRVTYTYTDAGDLKSYYFQNTQGDYSKVDYFYRDNHTLKEFEEIFDYGQDNVGSKIFTYTETEVYAKQTTSFSSGSKTIATYVEDKIIEEYFRPDGILKEVYKYRFGTRDYFVEEYEFYNEYGELEYTIYYDENGNEINTIYN
ncbi:hypothetical protein LPB144_00935 [Christiangramia salexigens]|uniref:Sugar-binding protein n=1 Tax=Christiangramia salexigens TaxID=1913577 RepID=A0A1L3J1Q8_9FLAO|nr:hypothetical protein LPB144_00935 [Christiangramia salexigens]